MSDLRRLSAPRALAALFFLCIAAYFTWAAWTDAKVPKLVWLAFGAVLLAYLGGVILRDRRSRD